MKCIGCGVKLQTLDPEKEGYVSEIHMIENGEEVYCKRCYDIIHYNKRYIPNTDNELFYKKMIDVKNKHPEDVICLMLDVLDIYGGFVEILPKLIGDMKVILLINKIDIMPKSLKLIHIEDTTRELGKKMGLNVVAVYSISAKSKGNIESVIRKIDKLRYSRYHKKPLFSNCYVVGVASVGKSTFINAVKDLCGVDTPPITTSDQFQTTLDIIKVELGNKLYIHDTPGIVNTHSFTHYLSYDSVKILTPKKFLRVRTYQLTSLQTLFLGGLVELDFEEGNNINVSLFVSNELYVHRTKLENALKIKEQQKFKLLVPPLTTEEVENLGKEHEVTLELDDDKFYDLIIPGIGFIHMKGDNVKFTLKMSSKVTFKLVESILS